MDTIQKRKLKDFIMSLIIMSSLLIFSMVMNKTLTIWLFGFSILYVGYRLVECAQ